ncbi:hypothetical protein CAP35_04890 [Chitinophagaceae bacterium IBVUCB1]|nr:hypothetical protein CAP35_04890 [Chitinophagaceae bacterium IBVUCB1]
MSKRILFLTSLLIFTTIISVCAQQRPIGYWRSHLPYNTAVGVAFDNANNLYVATEKTFFIYNISSKQSEGFSKAEGMADVSVSCIGYDLSSNTAIIGYENSNIDLYQDGAFYNLPDLKMRNISGSKKINDIYTSDGYAYISTDAGMLVINLEKREIKETYNFSIAGQGIAIKSAAIAGNNLFAATDKGLYTGNKNSGLLQSFTTWGKIDTLRNFISLASVNNKLFVATVDSVFEYINNTLQFVFRSDSNIRKISPGINSLWVCEGIRSNFRGKAHKLSLTNYIKTDSFNVFGFCNQVVHGDTDRVWVAAGADGFLLREFRGEPYKLQLPEGPSSFPCYDILANNEELWVAHGGYDEKRRANNNGAGFSNFRDGKWKWYRRFEYQPFGDSMRDFSKLYKSADGILYAGSVQNGLLVINPDGSTLSYQQNSFIGTSSVSPTWYFVGGFAEDNNSNLWMTIYGGKQELAVKTKEGQWYPITVPIPRSGIPNAAADIIVDDNNQKWYATSGASSGVIVYDDNNTPTNTFDDRYRLLLAGKGVGGLADNEVYSLAKDKKGSIWIGTKNGISIVSCPAQVIEGTCEAENRTVQYDKFAGYLFQEEIVKTIAVDGANRKWIGTNNGVWLISEEGDNIIYRFTQENSPLPSNNINKITIDPQTGDVYIGTEQGLVSYRSTATDGGKENADVKVFPNPVPTGYSGTIAIKGLVENADVRITDISGQLVFRTKALGGQAVWNGYDYTGRRPQSGVYLIFVTNKDGSQTKVGKMVFME